MRCALSGGGVRSRIVGRTGAARAGGKVWPGSARPQRTVLASVLSRLNPLANVIWWGDAEQGRAYARALADRDGPIIGLITATPDIAHVMHERHVCIDTTAAGGNAALLAEVAVLTP